MRSSISTGLTGLFLLIALVLGCNCLAGCTSAPTTTQRVVPQVVSPHMQQVLAGTAPTGIAFAPDTNQIYVPDELIIYPNRYIPEQVLASLFSSAQAKLVPFKDNAYRLLFTQPVSYTDLTTLVDQLSGTPLFDYVTLHTLQVPTVKDFEEPWPVVINVAQSYSFK